MHHAVFRRVLPIALALSAVLPAVGAHAASVHQGGAPPGINASLPTVSGTLVAKPLIGAAPTGAVICGGRDRAPDVRALMVNRGLVICTDEGSLVLLQISGTTQFFNRNWRLMGIRGMALRDHINAWGVLRAGGIVLNPTVAVQDSSRPQTRLTLISGRLVAKPIEGVAPASPVVCGDRDQSQAARALMVNRGLVICTAEGNLVLVQIASGTRLLTRDGVPVTTPDMTLGDHINARGVLKNLVMFPTASVVDTNLLVRTTNSQDFIRSGGVTLTLFVLQSGAGGPVQGVVHAQQRGRARVVLCGGKVGSWSNLRSGLTVDISNSIFNTRLMTYVDTDLVTVVSC